MNSKIYRVFLLLAFAFFLASHVQSQEAAEPVTYPDPLRFLRDVERFEASDRVQPPNENAVLGIGSSSMRGWHGTIQSDLDPLTVIPRGFGGSNMNDVLYFADRIVIPYKPRAIIIYEGDNDTADGIAPEKIKDTFLKFKDKVHESLPQTRICFLSIKPSISRWSLWPKMQNANRLIEAECEKDERLVYIDIATDMLNEEGLPKPEIFVDDNLHMNAKGYEIWKAAVRSVLIPAEIEYESR